MFPKGRHIRNNMDLFLEKTMFGLSPWSDSDKEIVKPWSYGEVIKVTVKRERNSGHHKKFFAMMNKTMYHLPEGSPIKSIDHLKDLLKFETGYFETFISLSGEMVYKPRV